MRVPMRYSSAATFKHTFIIITELKKARVKAQKLGKGKIKIKNEEKKVPR